MKLDNSIAVLNEKKVFFSPTTFFEDDQCDPWEIIEIINNYDLFKDILQSLSESIIETTNDFIYYLLVVKLASLDGVIETVTDENNKKRLSELLDIANDIKSKYKISDVILFVNNHIKELFSIELNLISVRQSAFNFIKKYKSGISDEALRFLFDKYNYLIIDNYEIFEDIADNNNDLFDLLFKEGSFDEIDELRFSTVMSLWIHIFNKNNEHQRIRVNELTNSLYNDINNKVEAINESNVFFYETKIQEFNNYLTATKNSLANNMRDILKSIKATSTKSVIEGGQLFKFEIPVKQIVDDINKHKDWELRQIAITHDRIIENGKPTFVSRLSKESTVKSAFIDFVRTNILVDEYYTLSHQQYLDIVSSIGRSTIMGLCFDEQQRISFLNQLKSVFHCLQLSKVYKNEEIEEFGDILLTYCNIIFSNLSAIDSIKPLCYGASMYTCSMIEKLLRALFIYLKKNVVYINPEHTTLSKLLSETDKDLLEIFNINQIKNLRFFLVKSSNSGVGMNYRNSLSHLYNISFEMFNPTFFSQILWLFTDVLNTIFIYVWRNDLFDE